MPGNGVRMKQKIFQHLFGIWLLCWQYLQQFRNYTDLFDKCG
jgi:hypothetical protein